MAEITGLGTPQLLGDPTQSKRPPCEPSPECAPKLATEDRRSAAPAGRAAPVAALDAATPAVDFTKFLRGFKVGQELELSASGFFGSGLVGGNGAVEALSSDSFRLALHVRAPGHNSDKPMQYTRDGDTFISGEGVRWKGSLSANGQIFELTNTTKPKERIQLSVAQPGTLKMTTWGFGGDNKPLTIAVKK